MPSWPKHSGGKENPFVLVLIACIITLIAYMRTYSWEFKGEGEFRGVEREEENFFLKVAVQLSSTV